ncbi:MAG: DMT family transporter [Clostridia bacterium]|nr:DMT family transporter [Clostridia bacterium]
MKKQTLSSFMCLLAAAIWGFAFVAQKAAAVLPAFTLITLRSFIGAIFLIPVVMLFDRLRGDGRRLFSKKGIGVTRAEWIGGLLCGLALTAATVFQQFGIEGTDAGKTAFITALYVVIVPIYGLFLGRRSPLHVWISIGIAVVGFYFLCIGEAFTVAPSDLLVLVCALLFAFHILVIDRFVECCDGVRLSCIQFFTVAVISFILSLIFDRGVSATAIFENALPILFLGIGSSGIAYTLQILGQKGAHPAVASVLLSMESVFGVLGGVLVLGERLSAREILGCIIVFAAVILSQLPVSEWVKNRKSKQK